MNLEKELARIKEFTEENDSIGAYIAGCELLMKIDPSTAEAGLDMVVSKLKRIEAIRDNAGHLPSDAGAVAHELYKRMLKTAKEILRPEHFQKFYMSF